MNGFRVTILTLLCLSVALMFYVVLYEVPRWQTEYSRYQRSLRLSEYDKKNDTHRRQMRVFDPDSETPEERQARLEEEDVMRRNELTVQKAEENNVVVAAKRREEVERAAEQARKAEEEASRPKTIGIVTSYDSDWNCIMMHPAVLEEFVPGAVLAVRRGGVVVCEVVVDHTDVESGQVSATVKSSEFGDDHETGVPSMTPAKGDEIIVSPFLSGADLRGGDVPPRRDDAPAGAETEGELPPMPEAQQTPVNAAPTQPAPAPASAAAPETPAAPQPKEDPAAEAINLPDLPAADTAPTAPQPAATPEPDLPSLDNMLHSPLF